MLGSKFWQVIKENTGHNHIWNLYNSPINFKLGNPKPYFFIKKQPNGDLIVRRLVSWPWGKSQGHPWCLPLGPGFFFSALYNLNWSLLQLSRLRGEHNPLKNIHLYQMPYPFWTYLRRLTVYIQPASASQGRHNPREPRCPEAGARDLGGKRCAES